MAVSQSSLEETDKWIMEVGGQWEVQVIVDDHRDLFKRWGLKETSTWYAINPLTLWHVYKLGTEEGIWCVFLISYSCQKGGGTGMTNE